MHRITTVLVAVALTGCFGAGPPVSDDTAPATPSVHHLNAPGAEALDEGVNRTFVWTGDLGRGASMPLGGPAAQSDSTVHEIPVDGSVGVLRVALDAPGGAVAVVRDAEGHVLCAPRDGRVCSIDVQANQTETWPVTITSVALDGTAYELRATVSPLAPVYGDDPTAAASYLVDAAGVRGGEPTLAVVDDGRGGGRQFGAAMGRARRLDGRDAAGGRGR